MEEYIHIFAQGKNKNHTGNVRSVEIILPWNFILVYINGQLIALFIIFFNISHIVFHI